MARVGMVYDNGYGVPQDYAKAREWYEKAAAKDEASAMTNLGWLYQSGHGVAQDYTKAREWYEKAAAKDDAVAMFDLGFLYAKGVSVPQDYGKAREWFEKGGHGQPWLALPKRLWRGAGLRQSARMVREGRC